MNNSRLQIKTRRKHFHTFDALRFFAFLKVFLLHLPIFAFPVFSALKKGGGIGVIFFFVLSGFLITYIILEERQQTGIFNLKNFFVRRILRIWPLFYLMILVAFLTPYLARMFGFEISNEGYSPNWLMSVLFLENYKIMISGASPNVSPLGIMWSLCIEEHFYILWGISLFFISMKRVPYLLGFALVTGSVVRGIYIHFGINDIDVFSNIDYFAFGALPAYFLVTQKEKLYSFIEKISHYVKIVFLLLILVYVFAAPNIHYPFQKKIEPLILGILFGGLLVLIIPEQNRIKLSDKNILSRLGKYTYGLYVYHIIIINFMWKIAQNFQFSLGLAANALLFSLTAILITIGVSFLSYHLFEKQFLKMKRYFY